MNVRTSEGISYLFQKVKHGSQHSEQNSTSEVYAITVEILAKRYSFTYLHVQCILGTISSTRVKKREREVAHGFYPAFTGKVSRGKCYNFRVRLCCLLAENKKKFLTLTVSPLYGHTKVVFGCFLLFNFLLQDLVLG